MKQSQFDTSTCLQPTQAEKAISEMTGYFCKLDIILSYK